MQLRSNIIEHTLLYLLPNTWKKSFSGQSIGWTLERLNWLVVTYHWPKIDHNYLLGRSLSRLSLLFLFFFLFQKKRGSTLSIFFMFLGFHILGNFKVHTSQDFLWGLYVSDRWNSLFISAFKCISNSNNFLDTHFFNKAVESWKVSEGNSILL